MTDDERPVPEGSEPADREGVDATPAPAPRRRANPAASAASRARRIGGLPAPAARPTARGGAAGTETPAAPASPGKMSTGKKSPSTASVSTRKPGAGTPRGGPRSASPADGPVVVTQVPAWLRWVPALVLTVAALATVVLIAVGAHGVWYSKPSGESLRDRVLAAAKSCTALTNEYSYKTIPQDEAKGATCTTGDQTQRYKSAMQTIVKPSATKLQATQDVQINAAGIESISASGDQWTVVLYGQTKITQKGASPRTDPFSAVVRMDDVDGKWLISSINLITSPSS